MNKSLSEALTAATLSVIRDQSLDESEMLEIIDVLLCMRRCAFLTEEEENKDEASELQINLPG